MEKKLERTRKPNKWIGGVCGGLGKFFGMDPTIWRLIFFMGAIFGFGSFILIYVIMWITVPKELEIIPVAETEKKV